MSFCALSGCSGDSSTPADSSPSDETTTLETEEITLLGSDWAYEGYFDLCPNTPAVFERSQFLSSDGVNIQAFARFNGNLVDASQCTALAYDQLVLSVAAANATDPVDRAEVISMTRAGMAFHYGVTESQVQVLEVKLTQDELSYQATVSSGGQSLTERFRITRLP